MSAFDAAENATHFVVSYLMAVQEGAAPVEGWSLVVDPAIMGPGLDVLRTSATRTAADPATGEETVTAVTVIPYIPPDGAAPPTVTVLDVVSPGTTVLYTLYFPVLQPEPSSAGRRRSLREWSGTLGGRAGGGAGVGSEEGGVGGAAGRLGQLESGVGRSLLQQAATPPPPPPPRRGVNVPIAVWSGGQISSTTLPADLTGPRSSTVGASGSACFATLEPSTLAIGAPANASVLLLGTAGCISITVFSSYSTATNSTTLAVRLYGNDTLPACAGWMAGLARPSFLQLPLSNASAARLSETHAYTPATGSYISGSSLIVPYAPRANTTFTVRASVPTPTALNDLCAQGVLPSQLPDTCVVQLLAPSACLYGKPVGSSGAEGVDGTGPGLKVEVTPNSRPPLGVTVLTDRPPPPPSSSLPPPTGVRTNAQVPLGGLVGPHASRIGNRDMAIIVTMIASTVLVSVLVLALFTHARRKRWSASVSASDALSEHSLGGAMGQDITITVATKHRWRASKEGGPASGSSHMHADHGHYHLHHQQQHGHYQHHHEDLDTDPDPKRALDRDGGVTWTRLNHAWGYSPEPTTRVPGQLTPPPLALTTPGRGGAWGRIRTLSRHISSRLSRALTRSPSTLSNRPSPNRPNRPGRTRASPGGTPESLRAAAAAAAAAATPLGGCDSAYDPQYHTGNQFAPDAAASAAVAPAATPVLGIPASPPAWLFLPRPLALSYSGLEQLPPAAVPWLNHSFDGRRASYGPFDSPRVRISLTRESRLPGAARAPAVTTSPPPPVPSASPPAPLPGRGRPRGPAPLARSMGSAAGDSPVEGLQPPVGYERTARSLGGSEELPLPLGALAAGREISWVRSMWSHSFGRAGAALWQLGQSIAAGSPRSPGMPPSRPAGPAAASAAATALLPQPRLERFPSTGLPPVATVGAFGPLSMNLSPPHAPGSPASPTVSVSLHRSRQSGGPGPESDSAPSGSLSLAPSRRSGSPRLSVDLRSRLPADGRARASTDSTHGSPGSRLSTALLRARTRVLAASTFSGAAGLRGRGSVASRGSRGSTDGSRRARRDISFDFGPAAGAAAAAMASSAASASGRTASGAGDGSEAGLVERAASSFRGLLTMPGRLVASPERSADSFSRRLAAFASRARGPWSLGGNERLDLVDQPLPPAASSPQLELVGSPGSETGGSSCDGRGGSVTLSLRRARGREAILEEAAAAAAAADRPGPSAAAGHAVLAAGGTGVPHPYASHSLGGAWERLQGEAAPPARRAPLPPRQPSRASLEAAAAAVGRATAAGPSSAAPVAGPAAAPAAGQAAGVRQAGAGGAGSRVARLAGVAASSAPPPASAAAAGPGPAAAANVGVGGAPPGPDPASTLPRRSQL